MMNKVFFVIKLFFAGFLSRLGRRPKSHCLIVSAIREKGYYVLPNFLSPKICGALVQSFDSLESRAAVFDNDRRIFGAENISDIHRIVFADSRFLMEVGCEYLGVSQELTSVMAAKLYAQSGVFGSGGGWHRDSFLPQFKAICYLSDVAVENGPFEYVVGSHKLINKCLFELRSVFRRGQNGPRYTADEIADYKNKMGATSTVFSAQKGTVILCDTSGLHRGTPISHGIRYACTNYYKPLRLFLGKRGAKSGVMSLTRSVSEDVC